MILPDGVFALVDGILEDIVDVSVDVLGGQGLGDDVITLPLNVSVFLGSILDCHYSNHTFLPT